MVRVHLGPAVAVVGTSVLLAGLSATAGLGALGWTVGIVCGTVLAVLLGGALLRHRAERLGPGGRVTLVRAVIACAVAALAAEALVRDASSAALVVLVTVALPLDAIDGYVARRTGTVTPLGARFDMEVDAFLIAVLSVHVAPAYGAWVLAIGAMRYAYVAAAWLLRWLRRPLPPRYSAKVVAAVQGVVLAVAAAGMLPRTATAIALAVALALLAHSFGTDVRWQWQHRNDPVTAAAADRQAVGGPRTPAIVGTGLAVAVTWLALVLPDPVDGLAVGEFLRIPGEGLALLAAVLVLPARSRQVVAVAFGLAAAVLVVVRGFDLGFRMVMDRPFDPIGDWTYLGPGIGVLEDSVGATKAAAVAVGVVLLVLALLLALPLAASRVARAAAEHRHGTGRVLLALTAAWAVFAVSGAVAGPFARVASTSAAELAVDKVTQIRASIADRTAFAEEIAADRYADTAGDRLLTDLRGKDFLVVFVESYGRAAVHGSSFSPGVQDVLTRGARRLAAAGYTTRSAFATSPTFGAASWLAHATFQSGLWVDSEQRYRQLLASDRLTLTSAFARAGWRTVFDVPANTRDWPEGERFYGFDRIYDSRDVGYAGPQFGYAPVPDQYTLEHFRRTELAPTERRPVMAEIDLVSSHHPWTPLPSLVPWDRIGDGSVFERMPEHGEAPEDALSDPDVVRRLYGRSIEYALESLVSFLLTYPDPDLVLVMLGDHQPHAYVSGEDADHDVPVTVIAQDPSLVGAVAGPDWTDGLLPAPDAPVLRMDAFRDRVLGGYGPPPG